MRKYYLDALRGMTVLSVVLYHTVYIFNSVMDFGSGGFYPVQYQDALLYLFYPWFMALLFLISGICARESLKKRTFKEFIRERTVKLLVPSTLGLFVIYWAQGYVNIALTGTFLDIPFGVKYIIYALSGTGVMWFIQLLWIYSVLLGLIKKFDSIKLPFWLVLLGAIPAWVSAQILNVPVVAVYRCGIYLFAFLVGYFVFSNEENVTDLARYRFVLLFVTLILAIAEVLVYFGKNYAEEPVVNSFLSVSYGWFACLCALGFFKKYFDRKGKFVLFIQKNGWGIYLLHYFPLSLFALAFKGKISPVLMYVFGFLLSLFGGILLYKIISHIPLLRFFALGMRKNKEKKCSEKT